MRTILVADDERALRLLVTGTLEIGNYQIIEADNGKTALRLAKKEKPDLVILDVMMPGMNGYEVCKQIKASSQTRHIKVLILTAKGQQADKEAAKKAQADFYLPKPFSPTVLLAKINEILGD